MMDQRTERRRGAVLGARLALLNTFFKKHSLSLKRGCKVDRTEFAARRSRAFLIYRAARNGGARKKIWPYV